MQKYLLIESRDPFDGGDVESHYALCAALAKDGHQVTLFLVQNGVLPVRKCRHSDALSALAKAGVEVLADDFSLRERAITKLCDGVKAAPIDTVVDLLAEGRKTVWH